jgi:hypothetical protein
MPGVAYLREFNLAQKVELAKFHASQAVGQATQLLDAVDAALVRSRVAHGKIIALKGEVSNISGAVPHPGRLKELTGRPPLRTDSLQALSIDLVRLERAVDGADADPSTDELASYDKLSRKLSVTLGQWKRLETVDVPRLNARLAEAGEKPI